MKANNSMQLRKMIIMALLSAIIVIMSFTPLGYIKTLGLSITLLMIPVVLGAIILGPVSGLVLGIVFGLTSFFQCFGLEPFGTMLCSINPLLCLIVCIVPRALMGFGSGWIFKGLNSLKINKIIPHIVANLSGALLNTVLFMSLLCLCFYQTPEIQKMATDLKTTSVLGFVVAFVGINGLIEAGVCFVAGSAISLPLTKAYQKITLKSE